MTKTKDLRDWMTASRRRAQENLLRRLASKKG